MELLFVTVGGALLGLAARFLFPRRDTYGLLLTPAIGAAVTAGAWASLVWLGMTFDGGWIWVIALAAGAIASVALPILLPRRREASDEALLQQLSTAR
jgi:quaternary ammonium compound-resistance protein SugE